MAELYLKFNKILFEKTERKFYRYDHATGLWNVITEESLIVEVHKFIKEYDNSRWGLGLFNKLDFSICRKIVEVLKGAAEQNQAFSHKKDKFFIHLGNTMLEFSANGEWVTCDFSPDYMSRNRTEIIHNPKAKAERFLTELLQPAMSQDDIETLQLYVGQILLGRNLAQKFLLITGSAGGGKSTLVNIIESLITRENCTQLRLEEGASRFETSRYVGKTLLTAKDVSSQFLNNRNAGCLKALTGGDTLSVEYKGRNTQADVVGNFNAIIVGNSTPLLQTDNDIEAWRRRMLWIKYRRKPTENPIANFDRLLIET